MKPGRGVEAVIFDLGGVLLEFDHMWTCRRLAELSMRSPEEVYGAIFSSGLEASYDEGAVSTADFHREATARLGVSIPMDEFGRIWSAIFTEKADTVGLLGRLKGRTRLFLLSNTNEMHFEHISGRFGFIDGSFDGLFLSYRMGMRKPAPEIYAAVIGAIGLSPDRLFYTDDKPEFAQGAAAAGMNAMTFTDAASLEAELKRLGVEI